MMKLKPPHKRHVKPAKGNRSGICTVCGAKHADREARIAELDEIAERIKYLEARIAILDRCNARLECLCRGEAMEHAAKVARDGERR